MTLLGLLIGFIFLIVISIIDVATYNKKNGMIPSVLTTVFLIIALFIGGNASLYAGAFAFLMAMFITDLNIWAGLADYKVFCACGLILGSVYGVLIFTVLMLGMGLFYKKIALKLNPKQKYIPYIPVLLFAYVFTIIIIFVT